MVVTGWQRGDDDDVGGVVVLMKTRRVVVAAGWCDRIDRKTGSLFGFAGKSPPKKFSGGGWPEMAADRRKQVAGAERREMEYLCVFYYLLI
nr:hypothetical protein [Tanacetum cinerariifolium]